MRLSDARTLLLDQVGPAVLAAQNLTGDLLDQETGVRGFVLGGGNPAFLDPYMQGQAAEDRDVAAIRVYLATGDHPTLAADLAAVRPPPTPGGAAMCSRLLDRAPTAPDPDQGKALFDEVRGAVGRLQADLNTERSRPAMASPPRRTGWPGSGSGSP